MWAQLFASLEYVRIRRELCAERIARKSERTKVSERQQSGWPTRSLLANESEPRRRAPNPCGPTRLFTYFRDIIRIRRERIMEMIQEQVRILFAVQKIDSNIYSLKAEAAAKPAQKQALEEAFNQAKQALKAKEDELKSWQLKRKESEMDLETKEKEIKKYQAQLYQIKTNKEYTSLQKEIAGLKADNAVLEDDILRLMDKIDKVKAEIVAGKEELSAGEKKLQEETNKIDQETKQISEKVASLDKEKAQRCTNVDKGLLDRYERILKAKRGLALVAIVGESCGGCHRVLPPQVINEARMKDRIVTCEFCARLLYWNED